MQGGSYSYRLFSRNDYSAFWALFTDNLVNLMVLSAICQFVFQMPAEIVFGRIVPGAAIAIIAGIVVYVLMARHVANKTGRDVTALPYGISTPVMFVYLFGVIGPIYWSTNDPLLAWQVGIGAGFVGGIVAAMGAIVGPFLKRVTPRAGMLGTLCGIALVFIGTVPLAIVFENPFVGFASLVIILWGLVGRFTLPFNLPAGLVALAVGTVVALMIGQASFTFEGVGFYPPLPWFGDLAVGIQHLFANPELFLVLVPVQIYNFIETMNNVESAEAAGDHYPVAACQLTDGAGTMIGAVFGSPFPTTVYIGHPAYKRMEARAGYIIGVGTVIPIAAFFGFLVFLNNLIPLAAAAPVMIFVAMSLITNSSLSIRNTHMAAITIAMMPHISNFLIIQWGALANALGATGAEAMLALGDPELTAALAQQGAYYQGHLALSQGAILTGLVWGAIVASVIDGRFVNAASFAAAGAAMALVGIIHAPSLHWPDLNGITFGYVITAAFLFIYPMFYRGALPTEAEILAETPLPAGGRPG